MKKYKLFSRLFLLTVFTVSLPYSPAEGAATNPVGFYNFTFLGNSDTIFSPPMSRSYVFQGGIASVSGTDGQVITVGSQDTPSFVENEFVYQEGVQSDTFYVRITSGTKAGMYYTIDSNTASTLTLDLNGDVIDDGSVAEGDTFQIIPYWTLNTLFPDGAGIHPSPTFSSASDISIPDNTTPGINLATTETYFYYEGEFEGGPGWRRKGGESATIEDDFIICPDDYIVVRNPDLGDTALGFIGDTPMHPLSTPINILAANTPQDNFISFSVPEPMTLRESQLFESGVFEGSPTFSDVDSLATFDNTQVAQNKASTAVYFYYEGEFEGGPGWRRKGGDPSIIHDDTQVFQPGNGYVIRKAAKEEPSTSIWTYNPSYLTSP